jgi:hypothetical protein
LGALLVLAEMAWVRAQSPPAKVPIGAADGGPSPISQRAGNSSVADAKARAPIEIRTGHPSGIYALAFSPDGKEIATTCGRGDPRVRFWDARTGQFIRSLEAHTAGVWAVAYTADGTRIVTTSFLHREDVCVWDARTHRKLMSLKAHKYGAHVLGVSPDGGRLVSIGSYMTVDDVVVWDLESGKLVRKHPSLARSARQIVLLADGRAALVAERERVIAWDIGAHTGEGLRDLGNVEVLARNDQRPGSTPFPMTILGPSGETAVVNDYGRATRVVETITGQTVWEIKSGIHDGRIALSPDGRTIARPSWGATIEVLDIPTEKPVATLGPILLPVSKLLFAPDGKRLAAVGSGSKTASVYLWDLSEIAGRPLQKPKVGPNDVDRWCRDLAGEDPRAAYRAVWALAGAPDQALPQFKAIVTERQRTTAADIDRWITDLDDNRFAAREAAAGQLRGAGTAALTRMAAALKGNVSPEQRGRLQAIVAASRDARVPCDRLFAARARVVLEQIGTREALKFLDEWASADPGARREAEARALVARLTKQQKPDE